MKLLTRLLVRYLYWTNSGIGGKIKNPEDFVVEEVADPRFIKKYYRAASGIRRISGKYILVLMEKRNLTTDAALKKIAKKLGIKSEEIGYAGLKDKFAVTKQYITLDRRHENSLKEIDGIELKLVGHTDRKFHAGDLIGNKFTVSLHECKNVNKLPGLINEIQKGFPNYFGPQRFGKDRRNHVIGKLIIKGKYKGALKEINKIYKSNYKSIKHVDKKRIKFFVRM